MKADLKDAKVGDVLKLGAATYVVVAVYGSNVEVKLKL